MQKKIRFYSWLVIALLERYARTILISFLTGVFLVVLFVRFWPLVLQKLNNSNQVIGIVGAFTPTNLPPKVQRLISLGLTDIDDNGDTIPAVATKWDVSDDGKKYTFYLRNDLYWHDRKKFTSHDVNYNIKNVTLNAVSDEILEVVLDEPFSPLPTFLSKALFRKGLIGLGPYKLNDLKVKGENVTELKLNPLNIDLPIINFKFFPNETIAKTAFKLGEVNVLEDLTDATPFNEWRTVTITEVEQRNKLTAVFFNMNHEFLKEKAVRQVLAFTFDKTEKNRVATSLSKYSWGYTNRVKQFEKDTEAAKKLLSENKSTESVSLILSTTAQFSDFAKLIAASWEGIGVKTEVKIVTGKPVDYQAFLGVVEIPYDPDQYSLWHSTQGTNFTKYVSAKVDKLLEDGRKETDREKRKKIYFDFQRYLVEDVPAIFLFHPISYTVTRK